MSAQPSGSAVEEAMSAQPRGAGAAVEDSTPAPAPAQKSTVVVEHRITVPLNDGDDAKLPHGTPSYYANLPEEDEDSMNAV